MSNLSSLIFFDVFCFPKLWSTIIIFMKILAQFASDKWYDIAACPLLLSHLLLRLILPLHKKMLILAQFGLDKWYTFAAYPRLRKFIWQATSNMSGFWKDSQFLWIWGWINRISLGEWGWGGNFHTSKGFFS